MDGKLNVFDAIARKMGWLAQRQSVLAQNIANADTPEYIPQDLKTGPFERALSRAVRPVQPAATHDRHMKGISSGAKPFGETDQRRNYEVAPSGNAVVLEEQLVKVGRTQMDYQALSNLYRKHLAMVRTALGRGA